LPVRVRAQQATAAVVAQWLTARPEVARVYFPGFASCDPLGLVGSQMSGPGSMVAFSMQGGYEAAAVVAKNVQLITHAVSLGGVDSLIQHPASLTHRPVTPEARPHASVLRLSVGLEDGGDLCADLEKAFVAVISA
jgi:cystathionine beta-lyase/cystathionine gamma-synthase